MEVRLLEGIRADKLKRYTIFAAQFSLAVIVSGTFVVSPNSRAAPVEWGHLLTGIALIYIVFGMLLVSARHRQIRLPAAVALVLALAEAIPGFPRVHAALSPLLFGALGWAWLASRPTQPESAPRSSAALLLPLFVAAAVFYGVGYRHQTSGIVPHIAFAMAAAGFSLVFSMLATQKHPADVRLKGLARLTTWGVVLQVLAGVVALVVPMLEIDGGLTLALARTAHITGAATLLASVAILAIHYRRVY